MTDTHPRTNNPFPPPYRAPGLIPRAPARADEVDLFPTGDAMPPRYGRSLDGWPATRIRKRSRRWRRFS